MEDPYPESAKKRRIVSSNKSLIPRRREENFSKGKELIATGNL